jgi:Na+/H+-dicarboxylate symporter
VSLTTRVLIALAAGTAVGLALSGIDAPYARITVAVAEPIGTLFINAIRMTVIPLVISSLIAGIASSRDATSLARLGTRGFAVFLVLLLASAASAALVAPVVLARVELDPAATTALRARAADASHGLVASASQVQTPGQWLAGVVPPNAMSAAVDGAMLPLIAFALLLGLALLTVRVDERERAVGLFRGIAASMLVVVRWVLRFAPLGVFALALPLAARLGFSVVGAVAAYIALVCGLAVAFSIVVVYPTAVFIGRTPLRQFARAVAPAQVVACSSRSSLAALPALIEAGRTRLGMSAELTGFFLPLATALFRVGATIGLATGALFVAKLYGVAISPAQLATIVATSVVTSFSIPGIPAGSIVAMAPVLASVGLPLEGMGILLGVDTIPDIIRTTANVTGQLAAATVVARGQPRNGG